MGSWKVILCNIIPLLSSAIKILVKIVAFGGRGSLG